MNWVIIILICFNITLLIHHFSVLNTQVNFDYNCIILWIFNFNKHAVDDSSMGIPLIFGGFRSLKKSILYKDWYNL